MSDLKAVVIGAVTNHLRTGCEDTPKEACAAAIWLDIEAWLNSDPDPTGQNSPGAIPATPDVGLPSHGFAADRPNGPRSREGHAHASRMRRADPEVDWDAWVRAIEDQAAVLASSESSPGLDVERLARAMELAGLDGATMPSGWNAIAADVAAAYLRPSPLSPEKPE
jgi:hypothetical protein